MRVVFWGLGILGRRVVWGFEGFSLMVGIEKCLIYVSCWCGDYCVLGIGDIVVSEVRCFLFLGVFSGG